MTKKTIPLTASGYRIGEDHHNAKITDSEVEMIRQMHESGEFGYKKLARMFDMPISTIRDIVTYRRRGVTPEKWKTVEVN